jgi:hypothetical protein
VNTNRACLVKSKDPMIAMKFEQENLKVEGNRSSHRRASSQCDPESLPCDLVRINARTRFGNTELKLMESLWP